jgi:hypothetical protein
MSGQLDSDAGLVVEVLEAVDLEIASRLLKKPEFRLFNRAARPSPHLCSSAWDVCGTSNRRSISISGATMPAAIGPTSTGKFTRPER